MPTPTPPGVYNQDGWVEVGVYEYTPHAGPKIAVMEDDGNTRYWVAPPGRSNHGGPR